MTIEFPLCNITEEGFELLFGTPLRICPSEVRSCMVEHCEHWAGCLTEEALR